MVVEHESGKPETLVSCDMVARRQHGFRHRFSLVAIVEPVSSWVGGSLDALLASPGWGINGVLAISVSRLASAAASIEVLWPAR